MGFFSSNASKFPWKQLTSIDQLEEVLSNDSKIIIFKHSTRCSISSFALKNFEKEFKEREEISCFLVDLLNYRDVSNKIAEKTGITHESPQVFLIENGKVLHSASHEQINALEINKL